MKHKALILKLKSAEAGDFLITSPALINFMIIPSEDENWLECKSELDYHRLIKFMNDVQDVVVEDKNIFEFLKHEDISLWQFVLPFIQPAILRQLDVVDLIITLTDIHKPSRIKVYPVHDNTNNLWISTVQSIAKSLNIDFEVLDDDHNSKTVLQRFVDYPQKINTIDVPLPEFIKSILRNIIKNKPKNWQKDENKILAISQIRHWINKPENPAMKYDEQFSELLQTIRQNPLLDVCIIDCADYSFKNLISFLVGTRHNTDKNISRIPFFLYPDKRKIDYKTVQNLTKKMNIVLCSSAEFQNKFSYKGVRLLPALSNDFSEAFLLFLPRVIKILSIAESVLFYENPDCILSSFEAIGVSERAMIIKAQEFDIPSIGLQHGMIFDNHYHYMHKNIATTNKSGLNGFVRPKVTCVWGEAWKKNLTETGFYPLESVEVTGNWKYDNFSSTLTPESRNAIKIKLKIPPGKKIVLLVSGNQNVGAFLTKCFEVIALIPDVYPLIKLHPLDVIDLSGKDNNRFNLSRYVVNDLCESIKVADLVISQLSTVVSESLLYNKKIILANFENLKGWNAYTENKALFYIDDQSELGPLIKKCIECEQLPDDMQNARVQFIRDYYFSVDGKSAFRVINVARKLIAENRNKKNKEHEFPNSTARGC